VVLWAGFGYFLTQSVGEEGLAQVLFPEMPQKHCRGGGKTWAVWASLKELTIVVGAVSSDEKMADSWGKILDLFFDGGGFFCLSLGSFQ